MGLDLPLALCPLPVRQSPDSCHNARIKRYPDGSAEVLIGSQPFGGGSIRSPRAGEEDPVFWRRLPQAARDQEDAYADLERFAIAMDDDVLSVDQEAAGAKRRGLLRSVRRARNAVKDLARSNEWSYFVTLTLDQEKVNRYDPVEVLKHLRHWLGNNVRRRGLRYVLVPEHHKDGAIHFHGLFNDALEAVDSGTMSVPGRKAPVKVRSEAHRRALEARGGHTVYNLPGWGWGFSTAIQLYGETDAAINYVCKYIGKEMGTNVPADVSRETSVPSGKIGGRWYYSGGDLLRPSVEWFDVDVREWEASPGWFSPQALPDLRFLTLRVTSGGEVLDPFVRPSPGDAKRDSDSNPEPSAGDTSSDGAVVSGGDPSTVQGDCDCRGSSFGLPAETAEALQACPTEEAYDAAIQAVLNAPEGAIVRRGHYRKFLPDLTKAILSSRAAPPGAQGRAASPPENDP